MPKNAFLIDASAGAGKTFALATHVLRLLASGEPAHAIAALTFSRAAAAEIFDRVVSRLAEAAASKENAAKESKYLLTFGKNGPGPFADFVQENKGGISCDDFRKLLRAFLSDGHRSLIGTIDSFMARFVAMFPNELGLQRGMRILDENDEDLQRESIVDRLLKSHDKDLCERILILRKAFSLGREEKTNREKVVAIMKALHTKVQDDLRPSAWGEIETIWADEAERMECLDEPREQLVRDFHAAAAQYFEAIEEIENSRNICIPTLSERKAAIESANPTEIWIHGAVINGKKAEFFSNCDHAILRTTKDGKKLRFDKGEAADTHKNALTLEVPPHVMELRQKLVDIAQDVVVLDESACMRAEFGLMLMLERQYADIVRDRGLLTFDDVPRLISGAGPLTKQMLEYRFDASFKHLALDEFQDTSPMQWNVLLPYVDEIRSDDARQLYIVGDAKQAIYGWRGGDKRLFIQESSRKNDYLNDSLTQSYRFGKTIADFVNKTFDPQAICDTYNGSPWCANVLAIKSDWARLWKGHESCHSEEKRPSEVIVRALEKTKKSGDESADDQAQLIAEEIRATGGMQDNIRRAVLVRTNKQGEMLFRALSRRGISATFEGQNPITDSPILASVLDLLSLSEVPDSTALYWGLVKSTPLPSLLEKTDDENGAGAESSSPLVDLPIPGETDDQRCRRIADGVAASIRDMGLPKFLATLGERILASVENGFAGENEDIGINDLVAIRVRLGELIASATEYARNPSRPHTMLDFVRYIQAETIRTVAAPTVLSIITAHRSKGLTFDQVFVPFIDRKGPKFGSYTADRNANAGDRIDLIEAPKTGNIEKPPAWNFPLFNKADHDKTLKEALNAQAVDEGGEALCLNYVSCTRPKYSLVVILPARPDKAAGNEYFSDHVRRLFLAKGETVYRTGNPNWVVVAREENAKQDKEANEAAWGTTLGTSPHDAANAAAFSARPERRTPSEHAARKIHASSLFRLGDPNAAAARGTKLHEALARIEWLTPNDGAQPAGIDAKDIDLATPSSLRAALERPADADATPIELWRERSFETLVKDEFGRDIWTSGTFDRVVIRGEGAARTAEIFDYKSDRRRSDETEDQFATRLRTDYARQMNIYRDALAQLLGIPRSAIRTTILSLSLRAAIAV